MKKDTAGWNIKGGTWAGSAMGIDELSTTKTGI